MARRRPSRGGDPRGGGRTGRGGRAERSDRGDKRDNREDGRDEREDRRRGRAKRRQGIDSTLLIGLCVGVVFLFGVILVLLGNYEPPPPPPKSTSDVMLVKKLYDKDGNEISAAEAEAIRQKNEQIKEENKQIKLGKTTKKRRTAAAKPKNVERNLAEVIYEERTGKSINGGGAAPTSGDDQRQRAPVPGWARDNSGREIGGGNNPAPQPAPAQEQPVQQRELPTPPPAIRRQPKTSPLAPWKHGGGDGETP